MKSPSSKHYKEIIIILFIVGLYFGLRIPNLTMQPIFADEAIYIRWSQVMRSEPTLRFLPLTDGKTPLFMWMMIPFLKVFEDPLYAGRILSVISGLFTLFGVLFLGWKFFNKHIGIFSSLLVAIIPYQVFFDRMALVDSMLTAFTVWSLTFALLLINNPRSDYAMFLGFLLGGGILTKTPGFFNLFVLPTILLLFRKSRSGYLGLVKILSLILISIIIALGVYNILRLGPGFTNLNARNQDYVHSPAKLFYNPLDPLVPFSRDLFQILISFWGIPFICLFIFGLFLSLYRFNRYPIVLLLWGLVPLLTQLSLLKTFTARYILFSMPIFMVIAAFGLYSIFLKVRFWGFRAVVFLLIIAWPIYFDLSLLKDPENAPLASNERRGYLEDWTAGYGLREIAKIIDNESKKEFVVVGTEGYFGTLPDGLQIYFDKNAQVAFVGGGATVSAQLKQASKDHPTFYVANKLRYPLYGEDALLIAEYPKAVPKTGMRDSMLLFRVLNLEYDNSSSSPEKE